MDQADSMRLEAAEGPLGQQMGELQLLGQVEQGKEVQGVGPDPGPPPPQGEGIGPQTAGHLAPGHAGGVLESLQALGEVPSSPSEKHGWRVYGGMMGPVQ